MRVDVDGDAGVGESGRADGAAAASTGRAAERQTRSSRALSDAGDGGAAASFDGVIILLARRAGSRSSVRRMTFGIASSCRSSKKDERGYCCTVCTLLSSFVSLQLFILMVNATAMNNTSRLIDFLMVLCF